LSPLEAKFFDAFVVEPVAIWRNNGWSFYLFI